MSAQHTTARPAQAVDRWPNRRIVFLAVVVAIIFYAVFRLPTTMSYLIGRARDTLTLLVLAIALTYFLLPLVDLLMRIPLRVGYRIKRSAAALISLVFVSILLVVLLNAVITPIAEDVGKVLKTLTDWVQQEGIVERVNAAIDQLVANIPEAYRGEVEQQIRALQEQLSGEQLARTIRERVNEWGGAILQRLVNVISTVLSSGAYLIALLIVPVFAYYFLTDAGVLRAGLADHLPAESRERYHRMVSDMDQVMRGYVRAIMLVSLLTGVATALTLYLAGVRVFLTFGILAGIANMVPVIGGVVATVLIAAITLLQMGFSRMLIVLLVYGAIQFVTDRIVSPKLMSENARLHPIAVILALLVAAEFLGMI
ncbi:MAG: AI-2E family transporter, partial [Armatimonadota bacterium]